MKTTKAEALHYSNEPSADSVSAEQQFSLIERIIVWIIVSITAAMFFSLVWEIRDTMHLRNKMFRYELGQVEQEMVHTKLWSPKKHQSFPFVH